MFSYNIKYSWPPFWSPSKVKYSKFKKCIIIGMQLLWRKGKMENEDYYYHTHHDNLYSKGILLYHIYYGKTNQSFLSVGGTYVSQ